MATSVTKMGEVLYGDYNGRLQPLRLMYFSLDSRCLVADHPESVQQEVSSRFCPNCNALSTNDEKKQGNQNRSRYRCLQCFECPCCGNILVPALVSLEPSSSAQAASPSYCLRCLYCQWTSEEYGLVAKSPSGLVEAVFSREKKDSQDHVVMKDLLEAAKLRQSKSIPGRGVGDCGFAQENFSTLMNVASDTTSSWKVANLDEAISKRKRAVAAASSSVAPISGAIAAAEREMSREATAPVPSCLQEDADGPDPALWALSSGHETMGMKEMLEFGSAASAAAQGAEGKGWPRRVRLHTKLGKRCKKDLATGRSEILIKPMFDPLNGDSSAAKKGGKWFKKDCCAALFIPWISIALLPSRASMESLIELASASSETSSVATAKAARPGARKPYLVLRLANPQLTLLRVRFAEDVSTGSVDAGAGAGANPAGSMVKSGGFERDDSGMVREDGKNGTAVNVVVRAKGWGDEDDWVRLEGKEDESLRPPGDWHHFPESIVEIKDADSGGAEEYLGEVGESNPTPRSLFHQLGDVAWVRLPLDAVSSDGKSATENSALMVPSGEDVVVSARFLLVVREREGGSDVVGSSEDDFQVPVVVRFPLSSCR